MGASRSEPGELQAQPGFLGNATTSGLGFPLVGILDCALATPPTPQCVPDQQGTGLGFPLLSTPKPPLHVARGAQEAVGFHV